MEVAGSKLQYHLTDLREFTEYSFHVSAFNQNGEGGYSEEVSIISAASILYSNYLTIQASVLTI